MRAVFLALTLFAAACASAAAPPARAENPRFYFGADLSYVNEMDDCGSHLSDEWRGARSI